MTAQKKPATPPHLSAKARRLWRQLFDTYAFDRPASVLLLTALCESWDRAHGCRTALKGLPLTIVDKHGGVRVHPLLVEERACREQVARLARVLRIHLEEADDAA